MSHSTTSTRGDSRVVKKYYAPVLRYRWTRTEEGWAFEQRQMTPHPMLFDILIVEIGNGSAFERDVTRIVAAVIWAEGDRSAIAVTQDWCAVRFDDIRPVAVLSGKRRTFDAATQRYAAHITVEDQDQSVTILNGMARGRVSQDRIHEAVTMAERYLDTLAV